MLQVPNQLRHEGEHVAAPDHEAHGLRVLVRVVRQEVHLRGRPQSAQEAEGVRWQVQYRLGQIDFTPEIELFNTPFDRWQSQDRESSSVKQHTYIIFQFPV